MIVKTENLVSDVEERADICIIGSGAGGAVMAKELSEAGYSVVVLEAGGYYTSKDFNQREADMAVLYEDRAVRATKDLGISILQGTCVGGTTVINNALCFRTPDKTLKRWAHDFGVKGMSPEEMRPSFEKVESEIRVQPLSEEDLNYNNRALKRGVDEMKYKGGFFHRNVVDCVRCGFCMLGCAYDRKQSMNLTYIPKAVEYGAKVYPNCRAGKIVTENGAAVGVEGRIKSEGEPGPAVIVEARVVVLSAGSINTPALLLKNGLCNGSGQVGKNLSLHPAPPIIAHFDSEIHSYRGIPQTYYCDEFKEGFIIEGIFSHPGTASSIFPSLGKEYMDLARGFAQRGAAIALVHDDSSGRVTLSGNGNPVIDYRLSDKDKKLVVEGIKKTAEIFLKAGARYIFTSHVEPTIIESPNDIKVIDERGMDPGEIVIFSAHPQGSCRMGGDPSASVVNSNCQSHEVKNLFVCDASVFPTSVGVNPQITVMAVATHAAAHIKRNAGKYFG